MDEDRLKIIESEAVMLWRGGADVEELLGFLRERGLNQPDSVFALMAATGLNLGEAQAAVLGSRTWQDQYERNLEIQAELAQAFFELNRLRDPDLKVTIGDDPQTPPDAQAILRLRIGDSR